MANIFLPLPVQYPKEFDELDDQELYFMCYRNALDLILIENATELFKKVIFETNGLLDYILASTAQGTDTYVLKSEKFKDSEVEDITRFVNTKSEIDARYYKKNINSETIKLLKDYNDIVKETKQRFTIATFAIEHPDEGAHYASFIYDKKKDGLELFDSMMYADEYPTIKGISGETVMKSGYTEDFISLAMQIFPIEKSDISFPPCIKRNKAVQPTGGFTSNIAPYIREELQRSGLVGVSKFVINNLQSPESQNHFCYMWAIWYIHGRMLGIDDKTLKKVINEIKEPLATIKFYGYGILYNLKARGKYLIEFMDKKYKDFFDTHFTSIWSQQKNVNEPFYRYEIKNMETLTNGGFSLKDLWYLSLKADIKRDIIYSNIAPEKYKNIIKHICDKNKDKTYAFAVKIATEGFEGEY